MALNHLFWSEKSHTGLHLVPCSSWHRLKHAILLSSILCVTFRVPPVVPATAQFPLARTVITSADKNACFQFKPTQFHLAPALTLLGSRDSAGAAAGEEWEGRAVQGHPKATSPRWLWPLSPVPAAPACLQCPGSQGTGKPQVTELLSAPKNKQLSISHAAGTQTTGALVLPPGNGTIVRQYREV